MGRDLAQARGAAARVMGRRARRRGDLGILHQCRACLRTPRYCDVSGTINVLEALGQPSPVGTAVCIGENAAGVAVWKLSIRERDMLGRWIVFHRGFMPAA